MVAGSSHHNHEAGSKVEATSTTAVEVVDIAQPEVAVQLSKAKDTTTCTGIVPTQAGSAKHPLTVIRSAPPFQI